MDPLLTIFVTRSRQTALCSWIFAIFASLAPLKSEAQINAVNISDRGAVLAFNANEINHTIVGLTNSFVTGDLPTGTSQIWPRSISWDRAEENFIQYYIQPLTMKMGIRYNYSFTFNLYSSNVNGASVKIPDGWYLLTMALVLPKQDDLYNETGISPPKTTYERYVSSYKSFVSVSGGTFTAPVSFNIDNMTANGVMLKLFVELVPLNPTCTGRDGVARDCIVRDATGKPRQAGTMLSVREPYVPYAVVLPFSPSVVPNGGQRDPSFTFEGIDGQALSNLRKYVAMAGAYHSVRERQRSNPISPEGLARKFNFQYFSADSLWLLPARAQIKSLFRNSNPGSINLNDEKSNKLIDIICKMLTERSPAYVNRPKYDSPFGVMGGGNYNYFAQIFDRCRNEFGETVTLTRVTHMEKIDPSAETVLQQPLKFNLMSNLVVSRGESDDVSYSASVSQKIPFGILMSPLEMMGFGMSGNMSISHSKSKSTSTSIAGSLTANLDFNVIVLNVKAKLARHCLALRIIPRERSYFYSSKPGAVNGFYICEPKAEPKSVKEVYTRVLFRPGQTPDIDIYSQTTQRTNYLLRGDRDISAFFYLTSSNLMPNLESGQRIMPFDVLANADAYFNSTQGNFSNTIVAPVIFNSTRTEVPSFSGKLRDEFQEFRL